MSEKNKNNKALTVGGQHNQIQLHKGGGLQAGQIINHSLANLTPEQLQNLTGKAAEEALRLEVKAREQEQDYRVGRRAIADHVDSFEMLSKEGGLTRQTMRSEVNTGAGKMTIESKSGAACFVATAAYGDANHPDVILLRTFRDNVLVHHLMGRVFIRWYWATGPHLAKVVGRIPTLKHISRWILVHIVAALRNIWRS